MATETATLLAQSARHELVLETQLEAVNNRLKEAKRRVRVSAIACINYMMLLQEISLNIQSESKQLYQKS